MLAVPGESAKRCVTSLRGVGPARREQLARLHIRSVSDLLLHIPLRYEDWRPPDNPRAMAPATFALRGEVTDMMHRGRGGVPRTILDMQSPGGPVRAVLFGRRWLPQNIRPGMSVSVFGQWEHVRGRLQCQGGQISLAARADIRAIYPATEGLSSGMLEKLVNRAREAVRGEIPPLLPPHVRSHRGLLSFARAIDAVHRPPSLRRAERGRLSLGFLEFLLFHVALRAAGRARRREPGTAHDAAPELSRTFLDNLPFRLTGGQLRAVRDIGEDMGAPRRMHRLLQGDVACGKTVVATWASLRVIEGGRRALWLVPTRLLAEQHGRTLREQLGALGVRVAALTADDDPDAAADLIVGTHSLLGHRPDGVGLLVIDEQQRFGVRQRAELQRAHPRADVLLMSATPIPRTLAGVLLGGVAVSTIDERPPGRGDVVTQLISPADRADVYERMEECARGGGGIYVICPAIEAESSGADVETVARSVVRSLPHVAVAAVHGRMSTDRRRRRLARFAKGEVDVLVGTTVLEVGLDVPRARMMVVEGAERFGLAELHQLRGRIGRGRRGGQCYLIPGEDAGDEALIRLQILQRTGDGAEIARADMRMRGIGDFFSGFQHGMPRLLFARHLSSARFQRAVVETAEELLDNDPQLHKLPELRRLLMHLYADSLPVASVL